jgi:hypothetical protein
MSIPGFIVTICILGNLTSCVNRTKQVIPETVKTDIRKCYGDSDCKACTSCNYCKWCNAGGKCGICVSPGGSKAKEKKQSASISKQCMAITKKGRRCTRKIRSGNYCWQHGG